MSNGRVSTVVSYKGALGSLDNWHYEVPVQLDADGNVIDYYETLEKAGIVVKYGEGFNAQHPYQHIIVSNGVHTNYTTGNNTRGVTEQLYGPCDISLTNITSSSATLNISGKGVTFSDTTKNMSSALFKVPLETAMCAYGRALGLNMTYSDANNLINKWADSPGWKEGILPFLSYCFGSITDEKLYIYQSKELVNRLKDWLIDQGAYADMVDHDINISTPTTVAYSSMQSTAMLAYELLLNACVEAGMDLTSSSGKRIYDLYQYVRADFRYWQYYSDTKVGSVTLSFGKGGDWSWSTYAHYSYEAFSTAEVEGSLVFPPSTQEAHTVYIAPCETKRVDWIGYSGSNEHGWVNNPSSRSISERIVLNLTPGSEGGRITLSNIGIISENRVAPIPGATMPSKGVSVTNTFPNWSTGGSISMPTGTNVTDINNKQEVLPIYIPITDPAIEPVSQVIAQGGDNTNNILGILPFVLPLPTDTPDFDFDPDVELPDVDTPDADIPDVNIPIIPLIPLFSGSGHGMVSVYNPTYNQVAELTQFLWSSNFFDNIKKIFQDPMEAIISLSVFYATPSIAQEQENIIVGTIDTGVEDCNVIDNQYIDIDCGTIKFNKYYDNVLDYIATTVEIYLPFIGYIPIEVASAVDKEINIQYRIDVLTGDCVAFIYVGGLLLYSFNGNCSVKLPISASNYTSQITGAASLIGSLGVGLLTKNIGTAAIGAAASIPSLLNHQVQRGGSLVGNAGAMGQRKPYLIITRQKPYNPVNYNKFYGYPSNETVLLSNLIGSGFTRVKDIRVNGIDATRTELEEIETLLKEGVIL